MFDDVWWFDTAVNGWEPVNFALVAGLFCSDLLQINSALPGLSRSLLDVRYLALTKRIMFRAKSRPRHCKHRKVRAHVRWILCACYLWPADVRAGSDSMPENP